jgi:hypothetical protein
MPTASVTDFRSFDDSWTGGEDFAGPDIVIGPDALVDMLRL